MIATDKICSSCNISKPLSAFPVWMKRGIPTSYPKCRECKNEYHRSPEGRHAQNCYRASPEVKHSETFKKNQKNHYRNRLAKYPEKVKAVAEVGKAIRSGSLVRASKCEDCNSEPKHFPSGRVKIEGHHEDYSKPLEVNWLCHPCHIKRHRQSRTS